MKNTIVELLPMFQLISVCIGVNPCVDYVLIDMANGLRSSDFDSRNSEVSICDAFLNPATWYRFQHDAGNKLIEIPVAPWRCGTQAPIWLNATHPTDRSETTAGVCATYSSENICGWSGTVRIRLCNESGSDYFVYQLAVPPGCPLGYCVDATSRKQCVPPDVWLGNEFQCGVSETTTGHSTVPLTIMTTLSTASSSSTERQIMAPTLSPSTEPASSSWSTWGPWSVCSKLCDYGFQSSRRTCSHLPCNGSGNTYRLCNEYNCQKPQEKETNGIVLAFRCSSSKEDTMLKVVLNQPKIHNILRKNINDICSQNVSLCCGWRYNGISSIDQEFVQSSDIYPAQGSLEPKTDYTVYYQIIAIVNEDIDRATCKGHSQRNNPRRSESRPNFLSYNVMLMASVKSVDNIFKDTGLIVTEYKDPGLIVTATMSEHGDDSCPSLTCVLPVVLCIAAVLLVSIIGGFCFAKSRPKLKARTEPADPPPEPPHYYEVLSADLRVNIQGLPYSATDINYSEYEKVIY